MTTSTQLPVCVYCSTARPADRTGCPTCGRPWIDVRIGQPEPVAVEATLAAAATQSETTPDPDPAASEETPPASSNGSKPAAVATVAAASATASDENSVPAEPDEPPFDQDGDGNGVHDPIENGDAAAPDAVPPVVVAAASGHATGSSDTAADDPQDNAETTTDADAGDDEAATAHEPEDDTGEEAAPPPPVASPEPVAEAPPPPPPPPPAANDGADGKRWLVPAGLAAAAVIVFGAILFIVLDRGGESEAALETTAAPTTQVPTTASAPTTTEAPATTAADPTTTAPTTTSTTSTTTTTLVPPAEAFAPTGEPIALGDLTLRASAIGPITFGTDASEAVGRLVSSLGTADETGVAGTELGMCAEGDGVFVRFGDLTVIVSGDAETGTLAGFRHESSDGGSAEPALVTPSGLSVGDTLGSLEGIYSGYKIVYQSVDGELMFQLMEGGEVLLWGPITSTETGGVVTGISSALICPDP